MTDGPPDNLRRNWKRPQGELEQFLELLGADTTLLLIEDFGGTRVSVPSSPPSEDHPLRKALGDTGMARLIAYFGGDILSVPLAREWRLDVYCSRGLTRRVMARKLGVTEKTVYAMFARRATNRQQLAFAF